MRNRSDIFDHVHFEPSGLQGTNRCFAARPRSFNIHFNLLHSMIHRRFSSSFSSHLRCERRAFSRPFKALNAGARPGNGIATDIGNRYQSIIKGERMCATPVSIFFRSRFLGLTTFLVANPQSLPLRFAAFRADRFSRALASSSVCFCSLSPNRQSLTVTATAIRPNFNQPLDIE